MYFNVVSQPPNYDISQKDAHRNYIKITKKKTT